MWTSCGVGLQDSQTFIVQQRGDSGRLCGRVVVRTGGTIQSLLTHETEGGLLGANSRLWMGCLGSERRRAAVCGDVVSGSKGVLEVGTTMGGES